MLNDIISWSLQFSNNLLNIFTFLTKPIKEIIGLEFIDGLELFGIDFFNVSLLGLLTGSYIIFILIRTLVSVIIGGD